MKVFVTGSYGLIGSHLLSALRSRGIEAVGFDSRQLFADAADPIVSASLQLRKRLLLDGIDPVLGSTEYLGDLVQALLQVQPTHIVHLGALSLADRGHYRPTYAYRSIVEGTWNLLEAIRLVGKAVVRLVYVSSSMVYGDFHALPVTEEMVPRPQEPYGAAKLCGETLVASYGHRSGLQYVIVRPSAVYGPTDTNLRIVQRVMEAGVFARPVVLREPETTRLDFTYVEDLAAGLVAATTADASGDIVNMTAGNGRSLSELAEVVSSLFPGAPIQTVMATDDFRPVRGTLSNARAKSLFGLRDWRSLEDGCRLYSSFLLEHYDRLLSGPARSVHLS